jgi:hypothetical protein
MPPSPTVVAMVLVGAAAGSTPAVPVVLVVVVPEVV